MKTFLSCFLIFFSTLTFSKTQIGPDPTPCISGPSTHVLGQTNTYYFGGLINATGGTPVYTWSHSGTASVTITPNPSNQRYASVTLHSSGTLCLKVTVSYPETGTASHFCTKCFETCDIEAIENFHGDVQYSISGFNVTFRTTNFNSTLYNYVWSIEYDNFTGDSEQGAVITVQLPHCPVKKIRAVYVTITKKTDPNSVFCKVLIGSDILNLCSNVLPPDDKVDDISIVYTNSMIKTIGENLSNYNIMIFDTNSKSILNSALKSEINLSNFANGIYFYKVLDRNNIVIKEGRFIKN